MCDGEGVVVVPWIPGRRYSHTRGCEEASRNAQCFDGKWALGEVVEAKGEGVEEREGERGGGGG